jgi:hypothetical protein
MMRFVTTKLFMLLALGLTSLMAGCLQLDVQMALQPDGSMILTERVQFSRALLDLDDPKAPRLSPLLTRESAEGRMKFMGPGVTLVSHQVRDGERASRESVAVFRVADMDTFTYVSPFLPESPEQLTALKAKFHAPMRDGSSWEYLAGWLGVSFQPVTDPRFRRRPPATQPEPEPAPLQMQMLRELRPVMADMMKQFRLKVTFVSYSPVLRSSFGWRNAQAQTNLVDLIDFAPDVNNDMHGLPWMENEEIMLDLLRWRWDSPVLADHLKGWSSNATLPALHREGNIYFRPSRQLFDRFFAGKTLTHHRTGETPAKFEEIGYTGPNRADPGQQGKQEKPEPDKLDKPAPGKQVTPEQNK